MLHILPIIIPISGMSWRQLVCGEEGEHHCYMRSNNTGLPLSLTAIPACRSQSPRPSLVSAFRFTFLAHWVFMIQKQSDCLFYPCSLREFLLFGLFPPYSFRYGVASSIISLINMSCTFRVQEIIRFPSPYEHIILPIPRHQERLFFRSVPQAYCPLLHFSVAKAMAIPAVGAWKVKIPLPHRLLGQNIADGE